MVARTGASATESSCPFRPPESPWSPPTGPIGVPNGPGGRCAVPAPPRQARAPVPVRRLVDFRRDVPSLDVPVYLLDGAAELEGRRDLAIEWFDQLVAPVTQRVTYQDAAHSVAFEQADEVQKLLVETVVPATYGR